MGRLRLKVVPGSSRDEIIGWLGESLKVKVKAPPEKGRANEAVIALLAERLGIDTSSIAVVSGHSSPAKVVEVDGMEVKAIRAAFPHEKLGRGHPQVAALPVLAMSQGHKDRCPTEAQNGDSDKTRSRRTAEPRWFIIELLVRVHPSRRVRHRHHLAGEHCRDL